MSDVPQQSVLDPLWFVIYSNDLDGNIDAMIHLHLHAKYNSKSICRWYQIGGLMHNEEGWLRLQKDIDQLGKWRKEWQIKFNSKKYEGMHFGKLKQARA